MLTQSDRDGIDVVLVSPRNPLNIGAAARAMANFGFARLTVVAPFAEHWREARSAIGAPELLRSAKESLTLTEALAGSTLAVGTGSIATRKPEQPVVPLPALAPRVEAEVDRGGRVALVFGPEKRGLTREDFSRCHILVEIPTRAEQPSMNLGQAVAVCLYELATRIHPVYEGQTVLGSDPPHLNAPAAALDLLAEVIGQTLTASGYSPEPMAATNRHDIQVLLRRLSLDSADARRVLGVFRRILYRLQHPRR
jgi:tRNA/rRNA methyltransferase